MSVSRLVRAAEGNSNVFTRPYNSFFKNAAYLAHIEPISRRKDGLQNEAAIAKSLTRYDLERVRVPTLVVGIKNCLYKTFPSARYTAEHIPGARLVTYPTGGHLAVGHQAQLWCEVKEFLNAARTT